MSLLDVAGACLAVTALLAYANLRWVKLPAAIGVMAIALGLSAALILLDHLGFGGLRDRADQLLQSIDFSELVMQGMLSMLLFASALHVDLLELSRLRWPVGGLALAGTIGSALVVGLLLWVLLPWAGLSLSLPWCLVFGALISPTDPIAVMGILKSAKAPRRVELVIAGESLFNDGVGVVLFVLMLGVVQTGEAPSLARAGHLLLKEAGGGLAFGAALGWAGFRLLKSIDSYQEEVLLTLALVIGGYALASRLHVSGPLAMVVAGLFIGNKGRHEAMSDVTRRYVDGFWELVDEILNALLFVLLGLGLLVVKIHPQLAGGAALAIAVTLLARWLCVGLPTAALGRRFGLPGGSWKVVTWGGLRGGISVALALSLPAGEERQLILSLTYAVVVFSVLVQGLTIGRLVRRSFRSLSQPS